MWVVWATAAAAPPANQQCRNSLYISSIHPKHSLAYEDNCVKVKETLKLVFDISCYSSIGNMYLPAVSLSSDVFDKNGPFHSNRMFVGGVAEKWRQKRGTFFGDDVIVERHPCAAAACVVKKCCMHPSLPCRRRRPWSTRLCQPHLYSSRPTTLLSMPTFLLSRQRIC